MAQEKAAIPPGTVITTQNWQKYKNYMSYSMQALYNGKYFWKMPADAKIVVGPTQHYPPPKAYFEDTEKYAKNVKIETLPDGRRTITGYVAGAPFPNPQAPMKGWKILVDEWFHYLPWLTCGMHIETRERDRFGNVTASGLQDVLRILTHVSDVGMPTTDPNAQGIYETEENTVRFPEQARYTTNLTIYYADPLKSEDTFLFIPALRRSLRLSDAARCAPFVGTDDTQDDIRMSWNGGIARWDAKFLEEKPILDLTTSDPRVLGQQSNYYQPIFFPKPAIGKWETRDAYIIDVRRIPQQRAGYCYGKQIMYVDKETYQAFAKDVYDSNLKFWKSELTEVLATPVPMEGKHFTINFWLATYDMQNEHLTAAWSASPSGQWDATNQNCENYEGRNFNNVTRYSTAGGLALILR
ncbi:MAG: DUF1329 domain-containing protein [Candidatus Binataceae bacterium]